MPISLHAATIPSMLQIIGAGKGWLDKAETSDLPEDDLVNACLIENMLPFKYQVKSMAVHSMGAIEGLRKGVFSPDFNEPPATFAALRERLEEAEGFLAQVSEEEFESFIGQDMRFESPSEGFRFDFVAEDFILTLSQPNFYFHATTAYDILRAKGIPVGKIDFLGPVRMKR